MSTKVQKWGNSLAVRLPKNLADRFHFQKGTGVEVFSEENRIVIKRAAKKRVSIEDVANKITLENRHELESWGCPVGNEIW